MLDFESYILLVALSNAKEIILLSQLKFPQKSPPPKKIKIKMYPNILYDDPISLQLRSYIESKNNPNALKPKR